ncbi:Putative LOC100158844 [Caligus rogercresseyi]|uniref:LOC100158844 n=1 Tax=Caligus rogercresseyi TaxID=217165 RepID=A0A7T8GLZ7_CALRO|nr:Putative LOC100158844 [Caligus rogercresseyi]
MALTNYGLYTWGHSKYGQCGHGSTLDSKRPCLVKALAGVNVIDISAGRYHSLAWTLMEASGHGALGSMGSWAMMI